MKITKNDIREAILEALNEESEAVPKPETGDVNAAEQGIAAQVYQFLLDIAAQPDMDLNNKRNLIQIVMQMLAKRLKQPDPSALDPQTDASDGPKTPAINVKKDRTRKTGTQAGMDARRLAVNAASLQEEGCGDQMHMPAQEPEIDQDTQMHHDQGDPGESELAKSQLYRASQYAGELEQMIHDGEELDAWVQAKITKASDYLSSVKHYLQYKKTKGDH